MPNDHYNITRIVAGHASDEPAPVRTEKQASITITPAMKAIERKVLADMRNEEAGLVLAWLNDNECIVFGKLPKALKAIEVGAHRR